MELKKVAVIPGDDAAPEAMAAAMRVLDALELPIAWDRLAPGEELERMPYPERDKFVNEHVDAADTVLFGSTNGTTPGVLHMRWGRGTFANVRPVRWQPGFHSPMAHPEGIDYAPNTSRPSVKRRRAPSWAGTSSSGSMAPAGPRWRRSSKPTAPTPC